MFVLSINLMRLDAQQITHNILKLNLWYLTILKMVILKNLNI